MTIHRIALAMTLAAALVACGDSGSSGGGGGGFDTAEPDATDPEPDGTDPQPDGTDPEPDGTDPDPDGTDPDPDGTDPDPDGTDPDPDTTGPDPDTTGPDPDSGDDTCETDGDCEDGWSCTDGTCTEDVVVDCCEGLDNCCEASADCDDGDDSTNDVCANTCEADGCAHYPIVGCEDDTTYAWANFDSGTADGVQLVDLNPSDSASVNVSASHAVSPNFSLHFGVPGCPTYYSGPLTDCSPSDGFANESAALNLEAIIPSIELAADQGANLTFWIDMAAEPALDLGDIVYDVDYLTIYVEALDANTIVWKSTEAFGVTNNSGGFVHQAIDLSEWAGETISVHFNFITDGAGDWSASETWHGAYLDDIGIASSCVDTLCDGGGTACPTDGDSCTTDECTSFANGVGGVCAYEWATPGSECDGCNVDADCGANDSCHTYTCDAGNCSVEVDASCCDAGSSFPASGDGALDAEGFEGDAWFTAWSLDDELDDNVSWQVSTARPYSGSNALYMGDPNSMTYEATPANPAQATAWTPVFEVDETPGSTVLSFQLYMSTEYDGADAACPDDSWDVLSVWVSPVGGDPEMVWASNSTICNTTNGAYHQVGVDLGAYAGEVVSVGFKFDSGDPAGSATANAYEGVYIDDVSVSSWCADECLGQSDCGAGDACTDVWCELGTCMWETTDPDCCVEDADCSSGDACLTGTCSDGTCDYDYSSDSGCCMENWPGVATEDFENGLGGYTTVDDTPPVVWHLTESDSASGTTSVTFSDPATGTYATPGTTSSAGTLWSPVVMVPPFTAGTPYVEFQLMLETEWDVNDPGDFFAAVGFPLDELCVGISAVDELASYSSCFSDNDAWRTWHLTNTTMGAWTTARVDLGDFRGESVQVAWEFSGDNVANDYGGPFIDDVGFGSACGASVECIDSSECTSSDSCYAAACENWTCVETPIDSPLCCWPGTAEDLAMTFEGGASWDNEPCTAGGGGDTDADAMWQVTNAAGTGGISPSEGSQMLYFGNGTDFGGDVASCGATQSAMFVLNPAESWTAEFELFMDTEPNEGCPGGGFPSSDAFFISVVDYSNAGTETIVFDKSELACGDFGSWSSQSINLDAFSGQDIALRFHFDSFDGVANDGLGIAIDDIQFVKGCE